MSQMIRLEELPPKLRKQAEDKLEKQSGRNIGASYNKYGASKTIVDGIRFDSSKEAEHYSSLRLLERAGLISDLKLQPVFVLQDAFNCNGKKYRAIKYIADFMYKRDDRIIVEDVKGDKTDVYKIKKKLFLKKYGDQFEFREV